MRCFLVTASVSLLAILAGCNKTSAPATASDLATDDQKTIYALGLALGNNIKSFSLSPAEVEIVKRGVGDAVTGQPALELQEWGPKIDGLARSRATKGADSEKVKGKEYQDKAATESGAVRLPSGLIYRELTAGSGGSPKATDMVKVNYRGTLIDGKEFDSSYKRNEPAEFPLNRVIPCWTEGLQKMKIGGKAQLVCPSEIAYGDDGRPEIPGGATLVFEVELLGITAPEAVK